MSQSDKKKEEEEEEKEKEEKGKGKGKEREERGKMEGMFIWHSRVLFAPLFLSWNLCWKAKTGRSHLKCQGQCSCSGVAPEPPSLHYGWAVGQHRHRMDSPFYRTY